MVANFFADRDYPDCLEDCDYPDHLLAELDDPHATDLAFDRLYRRHQVLVGHLHPKVVDDFQSALEWALAAAWNVAAEVVDVQLVLVLEPLPISSSKKSDSYLDPLSKL